MCHDEVRQVVQRERQFQTIFGELAGTENCTCVIDQNVDPWFGRCNLSRDALHFTDSRKIGVKDGVSCLWTMLLEFFQCSIAPFPIPGYLHNARPLSASFSVAACPIPDVAPVITTTLPRMSESAT
jgi:hypothetical protein